MGQKLSRSTAGASEAEIKFSVAGARRVGVGWSRSIMVSGQRPHAGSLWLPREHEHHSQGKVGPGERLAAHDESQTSGTLGRPVLGSREARGMRCSGPWPQCGQRVTSVPVHCRIHAATVFF